MCLYRFGNLHILFGLFLIALGICQILFAIQDDIHIAFRVTPVWVGTLVSLCFLNKFKIILALLFLY